ncbi:PPK2 family polyphosphate kinase [Micromonospora krabiensis]|uniref:Polyphosphate:nucleotide phosphotransferase, PPK2 family n=1 Tax=Micromonospora krabiensis TaxID=307121 RepID=A0A1C3N9U3_9ACTN|nr:PPK2 family polyphosphate kinase [Micromonospora krabiensis]SBV29341.1 polyphosphate:nucleotide phosphotransferase, PPK2 family [Micromonospora krabiensis]
MRELLRVSAPVDLGAIDPRSTPGLPEATAGEHRKGWAREQVALLGAGLGRRQEMLYATAKAAQERPGPADRPAGRVLLVLQAMDCGGKDGTIKRVAGAMNPLGLHIRSFGPPTPEELRHDFLWRVRRALPPPGYVGIFNRSHYEDVLVARVASLVPEAVWRARYDEINDFERELTDAGVTLVKVLLHISYAEQGARLLERLDDPRKHWKYNPSDIDARARWDDYQAAYAEALSRCATDAAPWFVVPADRKWYRDWAVAHLLKETFDTLALGYPAANFDLGRERERLRAGEAGAGGTGEMNGR